MTKNKISGTSKPKLGSEKSKTSRNIQVDTKDAGNTKNTGNANVKFESYNFLLFPSNYFFIIATLFFYFFIYEYPLFQQKADSRVQERAAIEVRISQEQASIAKEKADAARIAKEKADAARIAKEKADAARIAKEIHQIGLEAKRQANDLEVIQREDRIAERRAREKQVRDSWNWDNTNNKHLLIQFVNAYYNENNSPYLSADALHVKIVGFFNGNLKKTKNAKGWESFRLNRDRNAAGISGKRFKEIRKDLKNFRYDEIIEDHIYRTEKGQELWMLLRFPYIRKN